MVRAVIQALACLGIVHSGNPLRATLAFSAPASLRSAQRSFHGAYKNQAWKRASSASMSATAMGPIQQAIHTKIAEALSPSHLDVINESHSHSGPGAETHFKVVCVSEAFEGKPLIARHRLVNEVVKEEFAAGLHALSIQSKTPAQWEAEGGKVIASPPCMGGSKS